MIKWLQKESKDNFYAEVWINLRIGFLWDPEKINHILRFRFESLTQLSQRRVQNKWKESVVAVAKRSLLSMFESVFFPRFLDFTQVYPPRPPGSRLRSRDRVFRSSLLWWSGDRLKLFFFEMIFVYRFKLRCVCHCCVFFVLSSCVRARFFLLCKLLSWCHSFVVCFVLEVDSSMYWSLMLYQIICLFVSSFSSVSSKFISSSNNHAQGTKKINLRTLTAVKTWVNVCLFFTKCWFNLMMPVVVERTHLFCTILIFPIFDLFDTICRWVISCLRCGRSMDVFNIIVKKKINCMRFKSCRWHCNFGVWSSCIRVFEKYHLLYKNITEDFDAVSLNILERFSFHSCHVGSFFFLTSRFTYFSNDICQINWTFQSITFREKSVKFIHQLMISN